MKGIAVNCRQRDPKKVLQGRYGAENHIEQDGCAPLYRLHIKKGGDFHRRLFKNQNIQNYLFYNRHIAGCNQVHFTSS